MKKLITILFCLICFVGVAQNPYGTPYTQQGSPSTMVQVRGGWKSDSTAIMPRYYDTIAANLTRAKLYAGSLIYTTSDNNYWYRNETATRWVLLATTSSNCGGTRLINGSITWTGSGQTFFATELDYGILCGIYHSDTATLTLSPSDPSLSRIDVFYADVFGNVGILTGTPSPNPVKPVVNPLTQIEITFVYVCAGSTTPCGQQATVIYNENIEWGGASDVPSINFAYGTNPYLGAVSTYIPSAPNGSFVSWQDGTQHVLSDYPYTVMHVRLNNPLPSDVASFLTVSFYLGTTEISSAFLITNGTFGFNANTINAYQYIVLPNYLLTYNNPATFDKINIVINGSPASFQIDDVFLLSGANIPPVISKSWLLQGNVGTNSNSDYSGTSDSTDYFLGTNNQQRFGIAANGIPDILDTTDYILTLPRSGKPLLHKTAFPTIYASTCIEIFDSIGKRWIRDTCSSGGGGSTPGLNAVTAVDSTTLQGIKIATAPAITHGQMTFFGDSWTLGYGLPNISLRWSTLVANFLGYTENNAGLSSSTLMKRVIIDPYGAQNMVDRIPFIPYYATGDKLVFAYGLNDVRWNGANYTTANFVTDYKVVLDSAVARGWTGANIVLTSTGYLPPTSYVSSGGNPVPTLARQKSFDSCVSVLAGIYSTKYYDAYTFMQNNGARTLMQADSVHPNTQGDKVYALGFIYNYNEPVRFGSQKLAVNGLAEFSSVKFTNLPTTNSQKGIELVADSAGVLSASTLRHVYYNNYGNVAIGDNADSIPYRLSVDGSGLINDGLNISNKNSTNYAKWLRLYSDYTNGNSLIDAYSPSGGSALLGLNTVSKGNTRIGVLGTGLTTIGNCNFEVDSFYTKPSHLVVTGFAPARVQGGNLMYFNGNGTIISSNSGASTFDNLSLQGFGGNTNVGKNGSATARLHIAAGTATAGTAPLKFNSGTPTTTPETGAMQFSNGLWIIDSSNSVRDTIATRNWARNNISGGGVTSVSAGYGTNFTTITGTGSVIADTSVLVNKTGTQTLTNKTIATPSITTGFTIGGVATSRKIMVGNGTNYVPSTETWAVPGTSGNILQSDGTNWTSAALSANSTTVGAFNVIATGLGRFGSYIEHTSSNRFTALSNGVEQLTSSAATANTAVLALASVREGYVAKTANYTAVVTTDKIISCSTNAFTVTLPTAVGCAGQQFIITNSTAANTITIGTTSSQTFANVTATPTSITIIGLGSAIVASDGANWLQLK